jgi:hypothetical protein
MLEFLRESPLWIYAGMFGGLCMGYFLWFRTWTDEYELPREYTFENVSVGDTYTIECGRQVQTFDVLNKRAGWFCIEVWADVADGGMKPSQPHVMGWTDCLPSNRLIRHADLQAFPARLIGLEAT